MAIIKVFLQAVCLLASTVNTSALSSFADCTSRTELRNSQGELYSENYPNTFPGNSCKLWFISGLPGSVITLSFATVSLPTEPFANGYNCSQNFIKIGPTPEQTICGYSAEPYIRRLDDYRPFVWIIFQSGLNPKGRGFRLQYLTGPQPAEECTADQFRCDNGKCVLRHWCQNGQNECGDYSDEQPLCRPEGYRVSTTTTSTLAPTSVRHSPDHSLGSGCFQVLRASRGNFSMTLDPNRYMYNAPDCSWLIQTPSEYYHVVLTLTDMQLPVATRVEVYDGPSPDWPRLGRYVSYSNSFQSVHSTGRSLLVLFFGNGYMQQEFEAHRILFQAIYSFARSYIPAPTSSPTLKPSYSCFHQLEGNTGNFSMPPGPLYRSDEIRDCFWLIHIPDSSSHISLSFPEFDLREGEYVKVYDGDSERAHSLGVLMTVPSVIRSTGSYMLVKFFGSYFKPHEPNWIVFAATYHAEGENEMCAGADYKRCGPEDNYVCYHRNQTCNEVWDCPISGTDEAGCFGCSPTSFSCGEFGGTRKCFFKHDRCSGGNVCENHFDEENCYEELCSAGRDLYLCGSKRCILSGWVCDGTDDCGDNSDEIGCRIGSSRKVIIAAVVGSLVCSLLLVMALGCACKVYSMRHPPQRRSPRFDTPLSRLQAEMFRRRAPPPPYHEAMLTSRPYEEAVREYLAHFPLTHPNQHSQLEGSGQGHEASHSAEGGGEGESQSVQNLVSLMDLSDDVAVHLGGHRPSPFTHASLRLELHNGSDVSSTSNSDNDDDYDVDGHNLAENESGHIEMETTISTRSRTHCLQPDVSHTREDISEDSASATLSADGVETSSKSESGGDKDLRVPGPSGPESDGDKNDDKEEDDSDADSVCILWLDDPPTDHMDSHDTSDTQCLLQDA